MKDYFSDKAITFMRVGGSFLFKCNNHSYKPTTRCGVG